MAKTKTQEELKRDVLWGLQAILTDMIRGAESAHHANVQLTLKTPETSGALGNELYMLNKHIKKAAKSLENVCSNWDTIVKRARKKGKS
jgi:hypothetical protein